ncbi:TetR/AcrR family transcriptional regulator [Cryobacterium sp. N21]|uniref:TetR/AcrR family transcriptional regulator n=1 Tax=Cryobacterium sp. N21 TaxID=2048289 RepID=UPI000CE50314|nr:TetR/AcrR family transcriptional regulator [Cryobacterium sp. N21]
MTLDASPLEETVEEAPKLGRKRDHTRDPDILDAALEVLAETGYDGMTMEMVAARARAGKATLYRRWPSKGELVIDAVACMKRGDFDRDHLPDTGTLRGDLVAMIKPHAIEDGARKMRIMAGLMSMISRNPELAEVARAAIVEPRASANRILLQRAIDRGEISEHSDIDNLAMLSQSMAIYRVLVLQKPVNRDFFIQLIDGVVLPAVGLGRPLATVDGGAGATDT